MTNFKKIIISTLTIITCLSNTIIVKANDSINTPIRVDENINIDSIVSSGQSIVLSSGDQVVAANQSITGYTGSSKTASGVTPKIGYVAVRCKQPIRYRGDTRALNPIIPFGTTVYIMYNQPVPTPSGNRTQFSVQDTGDTDHKQLKAKSLTSYWLDVYVGKSNSANINFAKNKLNKITRTYQFFN